MTIREMRNRFGDTQSEFAERYHIPFRTIQNWETGVREPPEYVVNLLESRVGEPPSIPPVGGSRKPQASQIPGVRP